MKRFGGWLRVFQVMLVIFIIYILYIVFTINIPILITGLKNIFYRHFLFGITLSLISFAITVAYLLNGYFALQIISIMKSGSPDIPMNDVPNRIARLLYFIIVNLRSKVLPI